ncbi:cobalt-precorrin-6A reductase [Leptolyngbya iicbica]|uniref:Cobalt-precorrin-6A reductase n=2 Tax=Cyanophyceae TaxID=3028117 RepID=A0A4Q7ELL2_9CYAN|nr:cobalt-precorrin-6A reductase [Leptolyngbya sp. LK]RZM82699.1 cobalt-precorrin-6A reductase [Leptolyngbya sp. LK]
MSRLWLIGGTQESRQLVQRLVLQLPSGLSSGPACVITVTTEPARSLYPVSSQLQIQVGQLTPDEAEDFWRTHDIAAILDLSHPFATSISQLAIAFAQRYQLPYLRYERTLVDDPPSSWRDRQQRLGMVRVPHLQALLTSEYLSGDRTLLTLGYRQLAAFVPWQSQATLFARILPSPVALKTALDAGFTPERLIALRPPISAELETALWQHWQITQIVTKASGQPGGQDQKQILAARLGVRLLQIQRPAIAYPAQTDDLDTALQFALRYCN